MSLPGRVSATVQAAAVSVQRVAAVAVDNPGFPLALALVVLLFLLVQYHIDRRDPKLALAPVHADPDLKFEPPRADGEETT